MKRLFEWITNMEEEFILRVLHNRKRNLGYGDCSKCLAYSIESQLWNTGIGGGILF